MEESPDDEHPFGGAVAIGSETTEAEKEYERVLEDLRNAEGLKLYSDVYTKLFDSYFKLKENNNGLKVEIANKNVRIARFDDILAQYVGEVHTANKTIQSLRTDLAEAKALADAMHARELASVESLETIKKTLAKVEKELDARKRAGDDDAGATSAAKEKEKFEKEKAHLQAEVDSLRLRLNNALNFQEELEQRNNLADETIAKLEENLEESDNNAVRQNRLVEHLNDEINNFKELVEHRGVQISTLNEKLSKTEKSLEKRDKQVRDLTTKLDTAHKEQEAAVAKAAHFRENYENLVKNFEMNKNELINTKRELKNATDDSNRVRTDMSKLNKHYLNCMKKFQLLEHSKVDVESDRERLRQVVSVMEREITLGKKQAEADKRDIENLNREKDILNKSMQKIQVEAMENLHMIHLQEHRRKQLEHEIDMNLAQITKQRLLIRQLENDKDRMLEEAIALNEKIDEITDEVRLRTADILDLNKALRDEGAKNRKLSASLDDCRTERNMLHKNYTESLDEIQDLKQKLKMLAYQIEQMKEDISGKETGLKRCEATLAKYHKRTEQLKAEIQALQGKLSDAKGEITALRQEEARLNRIIQEGDAARQKLKKELESLMNERDVVGAQLVRRNDEISLLYEKIRILEVTLQRGERQYEQKREDIRLLRLEIIRLRKEKNLLSKGIENMTDLRLEVFNIERELGRERLRVRALEEALETPLNVHRWRKLQGTDPESVHLTQKLRLLQKKVLSQSETIIFKDRELKETKNLYKAVQDMLALQPSPEIQQTLTKTQRALAQRTTKIKCLIAEVNMRERQVSDLRLEMDKVATEMNSYKQKYHELKRALDADEARRLRLPTPITPEPDGIKT